MAKYFALSIGISKAGSLVELPGATNGAKDFATWAEKSGYSTLLLVDEKHGITAGKIETTIRSIIKKGPDRLLVYFAGHGVQPTYNTAYWLLSDWEDDSNEAINVSLSFANAKRSGISQIAVFGDACRSTVPDAASIGGSSIFPKKVSSNKQPQWDQFLATRMGENAQEQTGKSPAQSFGLFSQCLMTALGGGAKEAIVERTGANKQMVVCSDSLADYIDKALPLLSGKTKGASVQIPDVVPG